jgi:pheromone shutdown protein TraB
VNSYPVAVLVRQYKEIPADVMKKFSESKIADILINERDEYLAQSILESLSAASVSFAGRQGRLVAILGLAHLPGVQRVLQTGGVSAERLAVISSSSKHPVPNWPEGGGVRLLTDLNDEDEEK